MSIGSYLLERGLDRGFAPSNPVRDGISVNDQGYIVDAQGNHVGPYNDVSTLRQILSPTAASYADANNQFKLNPITSAQNHMLQRSNYATDVSKMPSGTLPYGDNMGANVSAMMDPALMPTNLVNQNTSAGFLNSGLAQPIGANNAQTAFNQSKYGLNNSQFNLGEQSLEQGNVHLQNLLSRYKLDNVDPKELQYQATNLAATLKRQPTDNEILDLANKINLSKTQNAANNVGLDNVDTNLRRIYENYILSHISDPTREIPYVAKVDETGITPSDGLNPRYVSPTIIQSQAMQNMTGPTVSGPDGSTYALPPAPAEKIYATLGTSVPSDEAKKYIDDQQKEQINRLKLQHSARQAALRAEMARLQAQSAQNEAEHKSMISGNNIISSLAESSKLRHQSPY